MEDDERSQNTIQNGKKIKIFRPHELIEGNNIKVEYDQRALFPYS